MLEGDSTEARAGFREALAAWRDLGMPWRVALTTIVMGTVLDPGESDVLAAAEEGRGILARLGARRFLAYLDALTVTGEAGPKRLDQATAGS